ncbi:MAG: ABC transporter permease [Thermaerobacter sp.]|nr:ABC transporter permease [Thermaerobacter sp.]
MRFAGGRFIQAIISLWGVITIVFFVLHLAGNPALLMAPPNATVAQIKLIEIHLGLNKPLLTQYGIYLGNLLHGNFGFSYAQNEPAGLVVGSRIPYTAALALAAFVLTVLVGVPVGVVMAANRDRFFDRLLMPAVVAGQSMPAFWSGLLLIYFFSVRLHWFPSSGAAGLASVILPAITLAGLSIAAVARMTRSTVIAEMQKDYVRTAKAKGTANITIMFKHVLRNSAVPIVTVITLQLANLLGGSVITETIFAWPGLGQLTMQSVQALDFPVVETIVILGATVYITANFLADVAFSMLDPRIRLTRGAGND